MREVAMVAGSDGKDAQPVEDDADDDALQGDAGPDRAQAGEMDENERDRLRIEDVVVLVGMPSSIRSSVMRAFEVESVRRTIANRAVLANGIPFQSPLGERPAVARSSRSAPATAYDRDLCPRPGPLLDRRRAPSAP